MDPALHIVLRGALALLFAAAAWHKARDLPAFRTILADYQLLPAAAVPPAAGLVVATEAALAAALLLPGAHAPAAWAALGLLALYTGAIAVNLARGRRHIDCGCGGPAQSRPLGPGLVVRNTILMAAALAAALPPNARALVALDAFTVAAGVASLALLYAAANHLLGTWPDHRRLRRLT